jgi:hypothetical protein
MFIALGRQVFQMWWCECGRNSFFLNLPTEPQTPTKEENGKLLHTKSSPFPRSKTPTRSRYPIPLHFNNLFNITFNLIMTYNDIQYNDIQYNDIQYNDIQYNDTIIYTNIQ